METDQYIGVDLHKAFFQVCAMTRAGERQWEGRYPRTPEGVSAFVERCTFTAAVAVEATTPTWSFVDQIVASGRDRVRRRHAQDKAEGWLRRQDGSPRCASIGRCVATRERGQRVYPSASDSRAAGMVPASSAADTAADTRVAADACLTAPARARRSARVPLAQSGGPRVARPNRPTAACAHRADDDAACRARSDGSAGSGRGRGDTRGTGRSHRAAAANAAGYWSCDRLDAPRRDRRHRAVPHTRTPRQLRRVSTTGRQQCQPDPLWPITKEGSPWLRWALVEVGLHTLRRQDPLGRWGRRLAVRKTALSAQVALAREMCREIMNVWRQAA